MTISVTQTHRAQRELLAQDLSVAGRELCRELSAVTDAWVRALFEDARAAQARAPRVALLAVGGYGRGELAPFSDLDLLLVHETNSRRVEPLASALWYPLWDAGVRLGHAVRSVDEQQKLSKTDLDTATALLTARYIAGDHKLGAAVVESGRAMWTRRRKRWLTDLQERVRARQATAGEVAYTLEPDLKDGHGGLRDVQSLWWALSAGLVVPPSDLEALEESYGVLVAARVALHRATSRPGETLRLEDQDAVAKVSGHGDADLLMADVAAAARKIAWIADEAWGRLGRSTGGSAERISPGVVLLDGEIELAEGTDPKTDPTLVFKCAVAAARRGVRIGRRTLTRMAAEVDPWPDTWPVGATDELVALLLEGHAAIPVLEALDQYGLFGRLLPEWEPVRSRPQRNAYHRFTVDRHLWEAAANASQLVGRVARPDLLVLGALFHDLGKGYPGDHTEVGMDLVRTVAPRMGIVASDVEILVSMVELHLLLPDVAMRRDLTDQATISQVASAVKNVEVLDLLHALTEADSKATGPSAWNSWKEELVNDLAARARHVLGGGDVSEVTWRLFPDAATLAKMAAGVVDISITEDRVTIVNPDTPGTFSRMAGVLALHGLDVLSAQAHSDEPQAGRGAMAASQFRVAIGRNGIEWEPVRGDMERAVASGLAIEARLADRARTYRPRRATQAAPPLPPQLDFYDRASSNATVIEVRAPNKVGVLYRITKALAEVGLDIRHATVQTIGMDVVDSFYVRTATGELVRDPTHREEIRRAVLHAVA
jgi:[protein-PII] uridylyltransferase